MYGADRAIFTLLFSGFFLFVIGFGNYMAEYFPDIEFFLFTELGITILISTGLLVFIMAWFLWNLLRYGRSISRHYMLFVLLMVMIVLFSLTSIVPVFIEGYNTTQIYRVIVEVRLYKILMFIGLVFVGGSFLLSLINRSSIE